MGAASSLLKRILVGGGHLAIPKAQRIIMPTGRLDFGAVQRLHPHAAHPVHNVLLGSKPFLQMKQRAQQGGLIGRGGLIRSPFSMDSRLLKTIKHHGIKAAVLKYPSESADILVTSLLVGKSLYGAGQAVRRKDPEGVGSALGAGLGNIYGSGLGFVGQNAAKGALSDIGAMIGKSLKKKD